MTPLGAVIITVIADVMTIIIVAAILSLERMKREQEAKAKPA